jgi:hypothetical protein
MFFNLSINNTVLRFYLMMLIAIIAVYTHQSWLIFLAFAVGVSAILGYHIGKPVETTQGKAVRMGPQAGKAKKAS